MLMRIFLIKDRVSSFSSNLNHGIRATNEICKCNMHKMWLWMV